MIRGSLPAPEFPGRAIVLHLLRTGAIVALYRVVVQGWRKEDAVREMDEGGFHHSFLWRNLDDYVLSVNVEALRRRLGVVLPAASSVETVAAVNPSVPAPAVAAPALANSQ